ncbi:copper chaperone PCu(A)C [Sandarakinorhabdus oryzae]|uniref:copper chaperone PCu(A)C n=1 Tax=Sandarakinorhabdus oryzae TaxID=2675220 RepID=UPI001F1FB228|nr:copper chaperone PCu(A)C [Sandarakinorhabdus oryzae]
MPIAALLAGLAAPTGAHEYTVGRLLVVHPVIRLASPVSKTGAGYLAITNRGVAADRLLSVTTSAANRSDLHGTIQSGAVMQMRAQAGGVPVPAGATVTFAPGGLHVMFIGLKAPLPAGQSIKARLTFEKAGTVDVDFQAVSAADPTHKH